MQKISEWLKAEIDSHSIFAHEPTAKEFKERTGFEASWPVYTPQEIRTAMEERGVGGNLIAASAEQLCSGYEIAESLATKYANYDCGFIQGRGSRFRLAIETLEKAGM